MNLYGLDGRASFGDILIELNNDTKSEKMGTGTNRPHFGTLNFNKETKMIKIKIYLGESLAAFELEDGDGKS